MPVGFAHGFCTIEPDTEVLYKASDYYAPDHDRGLRSSKAAPTEGYAGGNNVGILAALDGGAEAVWLLNPDAVPRRRALPRMIRSMNSDPRIGIVGLPPSRGRRALSNGAI